MAYDNFQGVQEGFETGRFGGEGSPITWQRPRNVSPDSWGVRPTEDGTELIDTAPAVESSNGAAPESVHAYALEEGVTVQFHL